MGDNRGANQGFRQTIFINCEFRAKTKGLFLIDY